MIVMKFGGTSVGDAERIKSIAKLVAARKSKSPIVVVSAVGGVTDLLIKIAKSAAAQNLDTEMLDELITRHVHIAHDLGIDRNILQDDIKELERLVKGVSMIGELTPKTLDAIMAFGERSSSKLVAGYLSSIGHNANAYNAYDVGLVTDSNYGSADVLPEAYPIMNRKISKLSGIPVITGFLGKDKNGIITTLGRGGSDYTASIVGAAVNAKEIQIWTDVNGIMSSDPKIVKKAETLDVVSYSEASELAFLGAKVLHPKTILPAVNKNIPVKILNSMNPKHKGTVVLKNIKKERRVASITCKKRISVVNLHTPSMFLVHGFLKKVFDTVDRLGLSVDMISTSEVSVSMTFDNEHGLDRLVRELKKLSEVELLSNRAQISVVGNNLASIPGIFGRIFSALDGIEVEMISSSASEVNQSFVVQEKDANSSILKLHNEFFGR